MSLASYHAKRNFKRTAEPRGKIKKGTGGPPLYLVQKHAARNLHYDFRLEHDGVLLSWAVPKGPSLDPAQKRLAVRVEDHPLEYGDFEGTIPKGQYGGGAVMLWDRGSWEAEGDPGAGLKKGHLKFRLKGKKLQGLWSLIRTRGYAGSKVSWLLVKDRDRFSKKGAGPDVTQRLPDSVVSDRSIENIAEDQDRIWQSRGNAAKDSAAKNKASKKKAAKKSPAAVRTAPPGAKRKAMPATMSPVLATLEKTVPAETGWIHEIKYDGYRILARLQNGRVRMFSRNGNDWTAKFPAIAADLGKLDLRSAWIDGEICVVDDAMKSDFQALQNALSDERAGEILYFIFDLPYLNGRDLRGTALAERRRLLRGLLPSDMATLKFSPAVEGDGREVLRQACEMGLEGIVSKQEDSLYQDGRRSRSWIKVKCSLRQEMVIGGFTEPQRSRVGLGALHLGVYREGELRYAGKVGTGFDDRMLQQLRKKLEKIETKKSPFIDPPRGYAARNSRWVSPRLVAEIEFTEWSEGGALRHPSFVALRADKRAQDVVRERPGSEPAADNQVKPGQKKAGKKGTGKKRSGKKKPAPAATDAAARAAGSARDIAGVRISHPDRKLFPEMKITKRDLADYYASVADWILPHLKDRPVSLLRCPGGGHEQCFYQKHAIESVHEAVKRISIPESDGKATYFAVNNLQGLIGLVQWGVVELHPWGSRSGSLEKPDQLTFDLDPGDDLEWGQLVADVTDFRTLLDQLKLRAFLKTTGGKGLHIVIPVRPVLTWDQAKGFTKAIATLFAHSFPERFIATATKSKRKGKNFIDYLRNGRGATAIAPYCVRARKNAPVAMPLAWEDLDKDRRFDFFNIQTAPAWLDGRRQDPWRDFFSVRQTVTKAMFRQVGYKPPADE